MAEQHLMYHWRHGWIPLTHAAALSKAKGNSKLADKYVPGASKHHGDMATSGVSTRQIHAQLGQHARITARPSTYRGVAGHSISGTDTKGRKVGVFVPGDRHAAQRAIDNIHGGRPAFEGHPAIGARNASQSVPNTAAPTTEREAFRMSGPDLRAHAANGSTVAQAEVDRRAGKGAKPARQFTRPTAAPAQQPEAKAAPAAPAAPTPADQRKAESLARWEAENSRAVPAGYTVKSRISSTEEGGRHMGLHALYSSKDERVGSVLDRKNGAFLALYNGKQIGDGYPTRRDAFAALAQKHEAVSAREAKKADAATKRQATAVPIGVFQPRRIQGDGTARGDAAAAKIKQSFTFQNHTVHIETAMTKEQTRAFLGDVHSVLLKAGEIDSEGITFHVPSGDRKFRDTRRGRTGGYVRRGQRTIFINPKVANGTATGFGGEGASDSLMPAARKTNARQYVVAHELGHVLDHQHGHTNEVRSFSGMPGGFDLDKRDANDMQRAHADGLSHYGKTNVAEGYAEAYAQWVHGGPGSNVAADAFAAKYGWAPPKWFREGRKP